MHAAVIRRRRSARFNARAGFTLVELIVAMLMLTIGLLGLAGVGAVVLKQMKGGTYQTIAASIAQSRFEQLEGDACASVLSGGPVTVRGMTEKWTVAAMGLRAKSVYDTVTFVGTSGTKKVGIHTVIACTP